MNKKVFRLVLSIISGLIIILAALFFMIGFKKHKLQDSIGSADGPTSILIYDPGQSICYIIAFIVIIIIIIIASILIIKKKVKK